MKWKEGRVESKSEDHSFERKDVLIYRIFAFVLVGIVLSFLCTIWMFHVYNRSVYRRLGLQIIPSLSQNIRRKVKMRCYKYKFVAQKGLVSWYFCRRQKSTNVYVVLEALTCCLLVIKLIDQQIETDCFLSIINGPLMRTVDLQLKCQGPGSRYLCSLFSVESCLNCLELSQNAATVNEPSLTR